MRPEVGAPSSTSKKRRRTIGIPLLAALSLAGCQVRGAPWFSLFGAYFPAWMLCGLIGALGAVLARVLFIAIGLDAAARARLLTYGALGLILALGTWQCGFGP
jgi:YtcA family